MSKTGQPYRVEARADVETVSAEDHVKSRLHIPPVLPPERLGQMLREDLAQRGFRDSDGGTIVRERNGVRVTVDPVTGDLTAEADGEVAVPPSPPTSPCGCRIAAELADALRQREKKLQDEVTDRLARSLPRLGCEMEGAIDRVTRRAIVKKARSMGEIKSVDERQDGSLIVVIET